MSQLRTNFVGWRPDQDEFGTEGLITADNVIHDTEGYKQVKMQTAGAFGATTFYAATTLASIRSMQIRAVGLGSNNMAAIAEDGTAGVADLSIGAEGEAGPFTTISTATLASVGGVRCKSFSVAELESGVFLISAMWSADITGSASTQYALTGEVTYTVGSESEGSPGSGATTSLEGTHANHDQTNWNATASAGVYLKSDGDEYSYGNDETQEGATLSAWLDTGAASGVWARCTVDSGTIEEDAGTGTWLQLNTSRAWAKKNNTLGTATAVITLECSDISDGSNIIDTATYTLNAIRGGTSLAGTGPNHTRTNGVICYAGVSLNSSGVEYAYSAGGSPTGTSLGNWMDSGANTDYWVRCTLNSGTLDDDDSGQGTWLALSTTRSWSLVTNSYEDASITLDIATDASGSNIIDTASYAIEANAT